MKHHIIVAAAALMATGCATVQTTALSPDAAAMLSGQSLVRSVHEKPSFVAATPGKGAFALVGVAAMVKSGNKLVADNDIEDPAHRLSDTLQQLLVSHYAMTGSEGPVTPASDDVSALRQAAPQADVVLDVKTLGWGFSYDGFDFSHYRVNANMEVRLIDMASGHVLASNRCTGPELPKAEMPTHDELLADDAALIKDRLAVAADHCARAFAADTFGIVSADDVLASIR